MKNGKRRKSVYSKETSTELDLLLEMIKMISVTVIQIISQEKAALNQRATKRELTLHSQRKVTKKVKVRGKKIKKEKKVNKETLVKRVTKKENLRVKIKEKKKRMIKAKIQRAKEKKKMRRKVIRAKRK